MMVAMRGFLGWNSGSEEWALEADLQVLCYDVSVGPFNRNLNLPDTL